MCRCPAYAGPGLPRPTTSQTSVTGVMVSSSKFRPMSRPRSARSRSRITPRRRPRRPGVATLAVGVLGGGLDLRLGEVVVAGLVHDADLGLGLGQLGLEVLGGLGLRSR